ncbi:hypothetical protein F441_19628 [Phytophthora nicotianae CJ01A1]|uniref:DDE Tnp4 domain-containing protein n=1 Tax=Phytophthora nicotianae CJ01A1 TaxID=1317063 RepID=W2VYN2_PHYNI|nr:hypothetical protein F441_19628 [Phytophthora nicotianae CJ01A1]
MQFVQALLEEDEEEEAVFDILYLLRPPGANIKRKHGGSVPGRSPNKRRDWHGRHTRLLQQYFGPDPIFEEAVFRRRYRMSRRLFSHIAHSVTNHDTYFVQKRNAAGLVGISTFLKITAALRVLAYSSSFDAIDENLEIAGPTVSQCIDHFCDEVIAVFGDEFLRPPRKEELERLLKQNERRGFPGMVGSIDCMHWVWKNCPMSLAGQHKGKEKKPTKVLEAVADYDLRIWHYNFGSPGSLNDINILEQSPLFDSMLRGEALQVTYTVNGNSYDTPYMLADGIYPEWSVFVKSIEKPIDKKRKNYSKHQEGCRKDVERTFGVIQARWRILDTPCELWSTAKMDKVMHACIIMHNMIVEDERHLRDSDRIDFLFDVRNQPGGLPEFTVSRPARASGHDTIEQLIVHTSKLRNARAHVRLRDDLIEHL